MSSLRNLSAVVPFRFEYFARYANSKFNSLNRASVSLNSFSVSPQKPTIMSVEIEMPGMALRRERMIFLYWEVV